MFRHLENINGKNVDAMYSAGAAMKVGMGVVKGANFTASFPQSATATDIFFVTKELLPQGVDLAKGDMPDYALENVAAGEMIVLVKPIIGEIFWTDQTDTVAVDDYVVVGTDGKFEKVTSGTSNLKVKAINFMDAGTHAGTVIEVVDWATISQ